MVNNFLFHKWHSWCSWRQQPVICHTWLQIMSEDKWNDPQSVQTKHISVHWWYGLDKGNQNSWRGSWWSWTSFQLRDVYSICRCLLECCYIYMENSKLQNWNYLLLKRFCSSYEVDLAVLVVSVSSSWGK